MIGNDPRRGWARPLPFLPPILFRPERPAVTLIVGWLTAFLPSIALAALVSTLLPGVAQPELAISNPVMVALVVVAAPIIETLIMGAVLALLLRFLPPAAAVIVSAAGWGVAHSLAAAAWGLVIWWPFLIFSILFVTWRKRSIVAALAVPAAVHMLQNLLPALLILAGVRA